MQNERQIRFRKACEIFIIAGILNFLIFLAGAVYLGGDAGNGKAANGHYYLFGIRSESGHKVYTEVSHAVFVYSKLHVYTLLATWPLVILVAYVLKRVDKRSG